MNTRRVLLSVCTVALLGACAGSDVQRTAATAAKQSVAGSLPSLSGKGVRLPDVERVVLDNGVVLLLAEKHEVPLLSVRVVLRGGAVADPEDKAGLASITAALLEKGAGERDATEFQDALAAVGGVLSARASREFVQIGGTFLREDGDTMIELLGDMLERPRFDELEFDKLRRRSIQLIQSAKDSDPRALLGTYGSAFLFDGHPYGRPSGGDETSLEALTHADVLAYYADHFGADRMIISLVGSFDRAQMREQLAERFGAWRTARAPLPDYADPQKQPGGRVLLVDKPGATQTYFWLGNVGVSREFERLPALDVANTVFGGSFTSMLNTALRIESGLTYGASASLAKPRRRGALAIQSFTATASTIEAIDLAIATLERFRSEGLGARRVRATRNYILGQLPTRYETSSDLAAQIAVQEFYGLGSDYVVNYTRDIANTTASQTAQVIGEVYPSAAELVMVMIGDAAVIRDQIAKYGAVTQIAIDAPRYHDRSSTIMPQAR